MTKDEYVHIRNLAWDILIEAKISSLPVNISQIDKLYCLSCSENHTSRYDYALTVSNRILTLYGYNAHYDNSKTLAVRILAPMIVLERIRISSYKELMHYTDLPESLAIQRFERLILLRKRGKFETSHLETQVLSQFEHWIESLQH